MPLRTTLNISLTPQLERFIESRVQTGRYQSASEVVREGLRLLELRERETDLAFQTLKTKLHRAASQADRGELLDPSQLLRKIDTLKRQRPTKRT